MKLSKDTLMILKNFSEINPNIKILPGNRICTKSVTDTILAEAEVTEKFPVEIRFYELGKVLGTASEFDDPDFGFEEDYVIISESADPKVNCRIMYKDEGFLTIPKIKGDKPLVAKDVDVEFELPNKVIQRFKKQGAILSVDWFVFESEGKEVNFSALDLKNPNSDFFKVQVADSADGDKFRIAFKKDSFVFVDGDYKVGLSSKNVAYFQHESLKIKYFVAADMAASKYTKA